MSQILSKWVLGQTQERAYHLNDTISRGGVHTMIHNNNLCVRVEVTVNNCGSIQGHLGTFLPENVIIGSRHCYPEMYEQFMYYLITTRCFVWVEFSQCCLQFILWQCLCEAAVIVGWMTASLF